MFTRLSTSLILLLVITITTAGQNNELPFVSLLGNRFNPKVISNSEYKNTYENSAEINPVIVYHMINFYNTTTTYDNSIKVIYKNIFNDFTQYFLHYNYVTLRDLKKYVAESPLSVREKSRISAMLPGLKTDSTPLTRSMNITVTDTLCFILVSHYKDELYGSYDKSANYVQEYKELLKSKIKSVNDLVTNKSENDVLFSKMFVNSLVESYTMAASIGETPDFDFPIEKFWMYLDNQEVSRFSVFAGVEYAPLAVKQEFREDYTLTDYRAEELAVPNTSIVNTEYNLSVNLGLRYNFSNTNDYFPYIDAMFYYTIGHSQDAKVKYDFYTFSIPRYELDETTTVYYKGGAATGNSSEFGFRLLTPVVFLYKDISVIAGVDLIYNKHDYVVGLKRGDVSLSYASGIESFDDDDPRTIFTHEKFAVSPVLGLNYSLYRIELYTFYSLENNIIIGSRYGVEL